MQFNLRTLMLATAAVAACAAAIAPFFRQLSELTQTRLVIVLGSLAVTNLASLFMIGLHDTHLHRISGPCLKRVRQSGFPIGSLTGWGLLWLMSVAVLVHDINDATMQGAALYAIFHQHTFSFAMIMLWPPLMISSWRSAYIEFCSNGLIIGQVTKFAPWSELSPPRWSNAKLLFTLSKFTTIAIPIKERDRADIEAILTKAIEKKEVDGSASAEPKIVGTFPAAVYILPAILYFSPSFLPAPPPSVPPWGIKQAPLRGPAAPAPPANTSP